MTLIELSKKNCPRIYWKTKSTLEKILSFCLWLRGLKLPPYFDLRARWLVLLHGTEEDIVRYSANFLRQGMVVIDVGANVGLLSRHFSKLIGPRGHLHAFEPDPVNCASLRFNLRRYPWAEVHSCALSDSNNPVALHLHPLSGTGNSLVNQSTGGETIVVKSARFDDWVSARGIRGIHLLKLDVEGGELFVLRGMRETIRREPLLHLIIEYCPKHLESAPGGCEALVKELWSHFPELSVIRHDGTLTGIKSRSEIDAELNEFGYINLLCSPRS